METTFYKRSYIFIAALFLAMAIFLFAGCRGSKVETGYPEFVGIQPNAKAMVKLDSLAKVYPDLAPYLEYKQVTTKGTSKTSARKVKDQRHITININSGNKDKSTVKDKAETVIKDKSDNSTTDKAKGGAVKVQGDGNTTTVTPPKKVALWMVLLPILIVGYGLYRFVPWRKIFMGI